MRVPTTRLRTRLALAGIALLVVSVGASSANPFLRGADPLHVVLNIAHAGASSLAPQNTIAAGRRALEVGADVWGVDARQTSDGVFVLLHDETLERTTDAKEHYPKRDPWRVDAFTLEELRILDAGSWFLRDDPFGQIGAGVLSEAEVANCVGEPIPTLEEALTFVAANEWLIDIEIKPIAERDPDDMARRLCDLIEKTGTAERVMISSFDHDILRSIKALDPTIPIGALVIFAPRDPIATLDKLQADIYLPSLVAYTPSLLSSLREAGIGVHVWTYNTEDQLERLAQTAGITGICTDVPQTLAVILERLRDPSDG